MCALEGTAKFHSGRNLHAAFKPVRTGRNVHRATLRRARGVERLLERRRGIRLRKLPERSAVRSEIGNVPYPPRRGPSARRVVECVLDGGRDGLVRLVAKKARVVLLPSLHGGRALVGVPGNDELIDLLSHLVGGCIRFGEPAPRDDYAPGGGSHGRFRIACERAVPEAYRVWSDFDGPDGMPAAAERRVGNNKRRIRLVPRPYAVRNRLGEVGLRSEEYRAHARRDVAAREHKARISWVLQEYADAGVAYPHVAGRNVAVVEQLPVIGGNGCHKQPLQAPVDVDVPPVSPVLLAALHT